MSSAINKIGFIALVVVALVAAGCGRGKEFSFTENKNATHQGVYPKFSNMPKAATQQFTEQERQDLANKLDGEAATLKKVAGPSANSSSDLKKAKEDARREAEETIRQIEQNGQ